MKPRTWRRYSAAQKAFVEFVLEVYPARTDPPEPPYDTNDAALWVGDMVARGVLSVATYVAGLNKATATRAARLCAIHPPSSRRWRGGRI